MRGENGRGSGDFRKSVSYVQPQCAAGVRVRVHRGGGLKRGPVYARQRVGEEALNWSRAAGD